MKKISQAKKPAVSKPAPRDDDDWVDDDQEGGNEEWLEPSIRERDSSRIRRQMEARRKLEQMMEAKRLKSLVEDWCFNDDWALGEEKR